MKQYESLKHGTEDFPVGIHDTVCEDGFHLYPHIHREFEFLVMKKGQGTVYIEEEKYELKEGEGIFINSGKLHIGIKTNSERAEFYAIVFAPEVFSGKGVDEKFVLPVTEGRIKFQTRLKRDVVNLLDKIHDEREGELTIRANLYLAWDIMLKNAQEIAKNSDKRNYDDVKRVMEYIRENYAELITLDDMALNSNMSKGYLCRKFTRWVHMTPFEYLLQVRVDKSCEMLKTTAFSIGEISQKCGFNSFSYFSKVFKEKVGCTPKEYRVGKR